MCPFQVARQGSQHLLHNYYNFDGGDNGEWEPEPETVQSRHLVNEASGGLVASLLERATEVLATEPSGL